MATFKYAQFFRQDNGALFDQVYAPGMIVPASGIYRCEGCGHDVTCIHSHIFPPQNHHQHADPSTPIRWRLIAASHWR